MNTFPGPAETRQILRKYDSYPYLKVDCGRWTYGAPLLRLELEDSPRVLTIGRYCSIAEDVTIFIGRHGRHQTDTLSTYPLGMLLSEQELAHDVALADGAAIAPSTLSFSNLDVTIGNDVWLGLRCIIMAGVTVGDGAIIATGAIVTHDVPPYAVIGGVPARVIRYRHDAETIERLVKSKWWDLSPPTIWRELGSHAWSSDMTTVLAKLEALDVRYVNPAPHPPLAGMSPERILSLFEDRSRTFNTEFPIWPEDEKQLQYTGGSGLALLSRSLSFLQQLQQDGAFADSNWRGLDYGCGWGRLASSMLKYGTADQLDLCDAWGEALIYIADNGFHNTAWKVSELLRPTELKQDTYNFVYCFSIFTHLSQNHFEQNITILFNSLRINGNLYFTVRHSDFLDTMKEQYSFSDADITSAVSEDVTFLPYPGLTDYGETIMAAQYLKSFTEKLGALRYLGEVEAYQHLYSLARI